MSFIHWRQSPQVRGIQTTLFNSITTGTSSVWTPDSTSQLIVCRKTANNTISFLIQGSLLSNGLTPEWSDIGTAVTASGATAQTLIWPYLRVVVGTNTATAKTASTVTQAAGVATFNCVTHGFVAGDYITVTGANQAGYNLANVMVLSAVANSFTYAVDPATVSPATTGTSITASGHLRIYGLE